MKKQTTIRDSLYTVLDNLINCCKAMNRALPSITLDSAQFQIFKAFNEPNFEGDYYYRDILVKRLGG